MLIVAMCFWETTTNTFHLHYGTVTPTLFYIVVIIDVQQIEEDFEPSTPTKSKAEPVFEKTTYNIFIKEHSASTKVVRGHEYIVFLIYWLSC